MTDFKGLDPLRRDADPAQLDLVESFAQGKINRRHFIQRGTVLGLSLASISAIIAACGGSSSSSGGGASTDTGIGGGGGATTAAVKQGGGIKLTMSLPGSEGVNPITMIDLVTYNVCAQVFEYLVRSASDLSIQPQLATEWKATKTDGGWLLSGQKTWCSRGAFAHRCFGIFRTDPSAERHRGLTYFLIPMDAPGVTVRPIAQLDGETGFAEVFFDEVFVPDEDVLGTIGDGWKVAMATAGSERGISLRSPARYTEAADKLVDLLLATPVDEGHHLDPRSAIADEVMKAYADAQAYKLHTYMTATKVREGHTVGAEASATKIFWSETDVAIHRAALRLLGESAELEVDDGRGGTDLSEWLDGYLFALSGPIYAGTNEIQRNVVAERMLGLPRA